MGRNRNRNRGGEGPRPVKRTEFDMLMETFFPGVLSTCARLGIESPSRQFGAERIKELCLGRLMEVWMQDIQKMREVAMLEKEKEAAEEVDVMEVPEPQVRPVPLAPLN